MTDFIHGLDENGCAPDCPIRILGEQSGVSKSPKPYTYKGSTSDDDSIYHKGVGRGYHTTEQGDQGTAARYFAQFYPDDEPAQERETMTTQPPESPGETLPINQIIQGDALAVLKTLPSNSCHSMVVDPPSSIFFMGKTWDSDKGGRDQWIAWLAEVMREALRCLLPGAHAFVWSLPRTSHMTGMALENAGFEIRDEVSHLFGSQSKVQAFMASLNDEQCNAFAQIVDGMGAPSAVLACFGSGFPKSANIHKAVEAEIIKQLQLQGVEFTGWEDE